MFHRSVALLSLAVIGATVPILTAAEDEPADLTQARSAFQKEVDFATRPIRERYLSRLDALKRSLGSRGDARGAVAVQEEIDRVSNPAAAKGVAQFAGNWRIRYTNGSNRRYKIEADGGVAMLEDNRQPVTRAGKIMQQGNDYLIDFNDGISIERVKLKGEALELEHWNPRAGYPAATPVIRGTGTISSAGR